MSMASLNVLYPRHGLLYCNDLTGPGGRWAQVLERTTPATHYHSPVVHVSAFSGGTRLCYRHLPKTLWVFWSFRWSI